MRIIKADMVVYVLKTIIDSSSRVLHETVENVRITIKKILNGDINLPKLL